jgi:hypothetical protein
MTIDQWVDFLSATPDHGPALCNSSGDYTEGKTELEQACAKAGCTYEEKKVLSDVSARIDRHIYIVKTIKRRQLEWEQ